MSNLNNITSKIIEDAKLKANDILEEAKREEKKIIDKKVLEANKIKENTLNKAEKEAQIKKERIVSAAKIKVRNENLQAKGEVIEKVFETALEKLQNIEGNEYQKIFMDFIENIDICGDEEIIVPSRYKDSISNVLKKANDFLKNKGKKGELTLYNGEDDITSGFIISKNGIYTNLTFDRLLSYKKDELEQEIADVLFK